MLGIDPMSSYTFEIVFSYLICFPKLLALIILVGFKKEMITIGYVPLIIIVLTHATPFPQ